MFHPLTLQRFAPSCLPASNENTMTQAELKQAVARAAIDYISPKLVSDSVIGVGTGSTANYFIDFLGEIKGRFAGAVASSEASAARLKKKGIALLDMIS